VLLTYALYLYVGLANGVLIRSLVDVDAGSGKKCDFFIA
jgi:hypothetical protein